MKPDQVLLIHKAFSTDDVSINITELPKANFELLTTEGVNLANTLWATLPSFTTDALLGRLIELDNELKKSISEEGEVLE